MTHTPVLLYGEPGSGKERVAEYMHDHSPRRGGPFHVFACDSVPDDFFDSALFGHVKGRASGMLSDRDGVFVDASGGTLLLDEVGSLPVDLQVKILRVLEDREVCPVGSTNHRKVDVRIIATTSRDLAKLVRDRTFSRELHDRLEVVTIDFPPLRARRDDILPLANHFLRRSCTKFCLTACTLSERALNRLLAYSWPGNVRELGIVIERAVVLAEGKPKIEEAHLPEEIVGSATEEILPLAEIERQHILRALQRCGGNRKETAQLLGIAPNTLWRKLTEYGLVKARTRRRKN